MTAGGGLHLGRTVAIVAALILVGFMTGRWGHRKTLGVSVLLMAAGMLMCSAAPIYSVLLMALVIAGMGEGVIEGLATPFVHELHPDEPGRYINFSHGFWSIGVLVTVVVAGALLSVGVSWRTLIVGVAFMGFAAGFMLLGPSKADTPDVPAHTTKSPREVGRDAFTVLGTPHFWVYFSSMLLAGGGEFCLTFWSASHIQLHYDTTPWAASTGVALFALGMVLGRTGYGFFVHQDGLKSLVVYSAVAGTIVCGVLPTAPNLWVFSGLLFVAGLATAPFWPSIQSYATQQLPELDSTMLLILLSCAGICGCGLFTFLMGCMGDHFGSLSAGFWLVPAAYGSMALLIRFDRT